MAFYETHYGYVGLGSTEIFRTAAQAAADIEKYASETAEARATGGLFDAEMTFRHSAARGRLDDLDAAAREAEIMLKKIAVAIQEKFRELEGLGAPNIGQMAAKLGTMAIGFVLPVLGFALQFAGIGRMSDHKKRQIARATEELEKLIEDHKYWAGRHQSFVAEGEKLSAEMREKGAQDMTVSLVAIPKKEEIKRVYDMARGQVVAIESTRKIVDVKDKYLETQEVLRKRKDLQPSGARLPEGFQQIYSPALKEKSIIMKTAAPREGGPELVTGQKLVYGGLAGVGQPLPQDAMPLMIALLGGLWLISVMESDRQQAYARG